MTSDPQGLVDSVGPAPEGPKRGSLRWLWFLLGGALVVVILCCGGIGLLVYKGLGIIKESEPYRLAWQQVRQHPRVIEKLGEPIEEASFPTGEIHIENGGGEANLFFQIRGPKGEAQVQSQCRRVRGNWGGTVTVTFEEDKERLQLQLGSGRALSDAPLFNPGGEMRQ